MSAERIEVAVELLHIDGKVGCALRSVNHYGHAMLVGNAHDLVNGVHRSEHVRHMGDADDFGARREELFVVGHTKIAHFIDRNDAQASALAFCHELPRHDVGMMLDGGDDNLVALVYKGLAKRACHEVDGFGRAAGEDNLFAASRIEEAAHRVAGLLVELGGLLRQVVHATVHIGIDVQILVAHGIEHTQRLLRGCRIVEIDQRPAIDLAREYREVVPYLVNVVLYHLFHSLFCHFFIGAAKLHKKNERQ